MSIESETRVRCDQCGRKLSVLNVWIDEYVPPWPWRRVSIEGIVGLFDACSDECEDGIRSRYRADPSEE